MPSQPTRRGHVGAWLARLRGEGPALAPFGTYPTRQTEDGPRGHRRARAPCFVCKRGGRRSGVRR
eukprot:5552507-Pyramimonas_sp.AAC.1